MMLILIGYLMGMAICGACAIGIVFMELVPSIPTPRLFAKAMVILAIFIIGMLLACGVLL